MPDRYKTLAHMSEPFRPTASWARLAIGSCIIYYGFTLLVAPVLTVWALSPRIEANPDLADAFYDGSTPLAVRWNLALFGVYIALLWGVLKVLHRLPLITLVGPLALALRDGIKTAVSLVPLFAVVIAPALWDPDVYQQMDLAVWLSILPLTLPLLFVQIGAEELMFRGYLQRHLAALRAHPVFWMVLPSVLFGLVHYDGTQPAYSAWAYVTWATLLGLVCADITARHGTLGPALAIHFVNNFFAMCVLAADDWLFGASLYVWPTFGAPWDPWIPYEVLFLACIWLTARLAIRR